MRDTGQGMTPEFLQHAFDRFRQADSSTDALARRARNRPGDRPAPHGASRRLHRGREPRAGARLGVSGPAARGRARRRAQSSGWSPEPRAAAVEREPGSLEGLRVLLAEDQWDGRELMAEILRSAGCEVVATGSAQEAFEALPTARPDVLVSDIGMPGEDGYSLLRRIRQGEPDFQSLPAIAVSAYAREEDRIRSISAGFQLHLAKPFEPTDLLVGRQPRDAPRARPRSRPPRERCASRRGTGSWSSRTTPTCAKGSASSWNRRATRWRSPRTAPAASSRRSHTGRASRSSTSGFPGVDGFARRPTTPQPGAEGGAHPGRPHGTHAPRRPAPHRRERLRRLSPQADLLRSARRPHHRAACDPRAHGRVRRRRRPEPPQPAC